MTDVVVITGIGGMGTACARRLGAGRHVVVADFDGEKLEREAELLERDGFAVTPHTVDVSDRTSVQSLVDAAGALGTLRTLVHTAGLSPMQATAERIMAVDVLGTEVVIDAFASIATDGTAVVTIASMAGYLSGLATADEKQIIAASIDDLLSTIAAITGPAVDLNPQVAYCIAKRVNQLRVERFAGVYGPKGGRVVSISPGIISTPMGHQELHGDARDAMLMQLDLSPVKRIGTAEDIAAAVEWLASPAASFVTGCDLRVDGGVTAALHGMGM